MSANDVLNSYIKSKKKNIGGWFARCDAEIFKTILDTQLNHGAHGAVAEIGVHHGKSFIALALSNGSQNCYAIDIFGRQDLNIDVSGKGDRDKFMSNLCENGIRADDIHIDARLSSDVLPQDIIDSVGKVRFFHIDGGHHFDAITSDLKLAEAVMLDDGVVSIDDVFRPEWPEVSIGTFAYLREANTELLIFAIGFNKTYLCKRQFAEHYRTALLANDFLTMHLSKKYKARGDDILVFQQYPLPEWNKSQRFFNYLLTYHPDLAFQYWKSARNK